MTEKSDKSTAPENLVLCGANSYEEKYYFNDQFGNLPQTVKDELQILCVLFTEEVGGILTLEFSPEGQLLFKTLVDDYDYYYDEIEAGVRISRLRKEKQELLEALELYYKTFFMDGSGSSGGSGQ
ncbi:MAG: hypothetical protein IIY77_07595 [Lachnospiraceae bacterium]|nr:hypothetical protein [Lachnospiraceae bacterium]